MDNKPRRGSTTGIPIFLAALFALALSAAGLAAQSWRPLPPFGGPVTALAAAQGSGGTPLLYAGTKTAGPVRSRNAGATWILPAPVPDTFSHILELVVDRRDPAVVFAAAQNPFTEESAGVLRSLDGGARWQPANQGLLSPRGRPWRVQDLATDPFDARKLYAATEDGLYQTLDRGESWQQVGLDGRFIFAVAANPFREGALVASVVRQGEFGIEVSADGGATWTPSDNGIEGAFRTLVFHPTAPNTVFALGNGWHTHVSRDGGGTWTNLGVILGSLAFGPGGTLFGASYNADGILKSTDGGLRWSPAGALPDRISQLLAANGRLYAAGDLGVWVSTDNGASWQPSSRGLSARNIGDLVESGPVLYGSFAEGARASENGGERWRPLEDATDPQSIIGRVLAADPRGAVYAVKTVGEFGDFDVFIRSTDRGATWTAIASPGLGGDFSGLAVDPRRPAVLYAGSSERSGNDQPPCHLARSVNRGRTWTCLLIEASVDRLAVDPSSSVLYTMAGGGIYALVDGTRPRLESRSTGLPANGVQDFDFDPRRPGTLYAATTEGVFRSGNGGRSWTRTSGGLPAGAVVHSVEVDPVRPNVVYAGLQGRVYRSLNAGRTWQLLGEGLPAEAPIVDLLASASDPDRLYAVAAGRGLFVLDPAAP